MLVASASIPGVFPPVMVRVENGSESFDELHVDRGTTIPLFVIPEAGLIEMQPNKLQRRAQVHIIINGGLSVPAKATALRPLAIVSRSFAATLMHSSRKSLEVVAALAQRLDLTLSFSSIPVTYPYKGTLGFDNDTMHALFEYGARCAEAGRFWMTFDEAMERGRELASTSTTQSDDCPVAARAVGATQVSER